MEPKKESERSEPTLNKTPTTRKSSSSFLGDFIASDAADVKDYVVKNVLLPRAKSLLLDLIRNTAEMFIMGPRGVSNGGNRDYSRMSSSTRLGRDYVPGESTMRPANTYVSYPEALFESYEDALDSRGDMIDYVSEYPFLKISDYLYYTNHSNDDEYTYQNYGWSADVVRNSTIVDIPGGHYVIKLPRPKYIGNRR